MHHIYHTKAIILGSNHAGEANRRLFLYTEDLGLIQAVAQGIRLEKSKLRFALQDFSLATVDLVRGKHTWRITSASFIESFPVAIADRETYILLQSVARLLIRVCVDEEANKNIFEDVLTAFRFLNNPITQEVRSQTEIFLVLRILHHLGYIGNTETYTTLLVGDFDPNREAYRKLEKKTLLFEINRALKESQL